MDIVPEPDIELALRLSWPLICALACQARLTHQSLEALVNQAIAEHLARSAA